MRILTIRQPWLWALVAGVKPVENRSRNIAGSYRGPVALHASKGPHDHVGFSTIFELTSVRSFPLVFGMIAGVAELVDVHHADTCENDAGWCTPWSDPESWHLVFSDVRALPTPIPFTGGQGLRRLDAETEIRVLEAIA